jgi:hypothetical protein
MIMTTKKSTTTAAGTASDLESLRLPELQARYRDATGTATKCPTRAWLIKGIRAAQAQAAREAADQAQAQEAAQPQSSGQTGASAPAAEQAATAAPPAEQAGPARDQAAADDTQAGQGAQGGATTAGRAATQGTATGQPAATREAAPSEPATPAATTEAAPPEKLSKLTVEQLQDRYRAVLQRDTGSSSKGYLLWKIRQAQRGKVPVGPRPARRSEGEDRDFRVLPLRLEAQSVAALDEAVKRLGIASRTALFRAAIHDYLEKEGEAEVAGRFGAGE